MVHGRHKWIAEAIGLLCRPKMGSDDETVVEGEATLLIAAPDENEAAIEVKYGQETLLVTRKAMHSMDVAIDANSNKPTAFWKAFFVITAVTDILQEDLMNYSTPFSTEEIKQFDWNDVITRSCKCILGRWSIICQFCHD